MNISSPADRLLSPDRPLVIAHRGASIEAPENTIAAFERAVELGADALELDVHLSADGQVVVLHDPTLDRTTNARGPVAARTVSDLREVDAGASFSPDGGRTFPFRERGVYVPTFAELLERFPDVPLLVEVKTPAAMAALADVVRHHGAERRVVPASTHDDALHAFRQPPFHCGGSRRDIARLYFGSLVGAPLPRSSRYGLLAVPYRWRGLHVPTPRFIRAARMAGAAVHVWTVDDPDTARRLWESGVSGIVTNDPAVMCEARPARRESSRTEP